jgi:valyl-tRNA synthetase
LAEDKIKGMKHFGNKLWNITRFVLANLKSYEVGVKSYELKGITKADDEIIECLKFSINEATEHLENFRLHAAAQEMYELTWHHFADVYIEASKVQLANPEQKANTQTILHNSLLIILKLLHPFMPFVTEEIWGKLKESKLVDGKILMIQEWPK